MVQTVKTIINFVEGQHQGGGTGGGGIESITAASTGDLLLYSVLAILIVGIIALTINFLLRNKNTASLGKHSSTKALYLLRNNKLTAIFAGLLAILAIVTAFSIFGNIAQAKAEDGTISITPKVSAYVNDDGTITFDSAVLKTDDTENIYVYKGITAELLSTKLEAGQATWNVNLNEDNIYSGNVPGSSYQDININNENQITFSVEGMTLDLAKTLINTDVVALYIDVEEIDTTPKTITIQSDEFGMLKDSIDGTPTDIPFTYTYEYDEEITYKIIEDTGSVQIYNGNDLDHELFQVIDTDTYYFKGWFKDEQELDPGKYELTEDVLLEARHDNFVNITFISDENGQLKQNSQKPTSEKIIYQVPKNFPFKVYTFDDRTYINCANLHVENVNNFRFDFENWIGSDGKIYKGSEDGIEYKVGENGTDITATHKAEEESFEVTIKSATANKMFHYTFHNESGSIEGNADFIVDPNTIEHKIDFTQTHANKYSIGQDNSLMYTFKATDGNTYWGRIQDCETNGYDQIDYWTVNNGQTKLEHNTTYNFTEDGYYDFQAHFYNERHYKATFSANQGSFSDVPQAEGWWGTYAGDNLLIIQKYFPENTSYQNILNEVETVELSKEGFTQDGWDVNPDTSTTLTSNTMWTAKWVEDIQKYAATFYASEGLFSSVDETWSLSVDKKTALKYFDAGTSYETILNEVNAFKPTYTGYAIKAWTPDVEGDQLIEDTKWTASWMLDHTDMNIQTLRDSCYFDVDLNNSTAMTQETAEHVNNYTIQSIRNMDSSYTGNTIKWMNDAEYGDYLSISYRSISDETVHEWSGTITPQENFEYVFEGFYYNGEKLKLNESCQITANDYNIIQLNFIAKEIIDVDFYADTTQAEPIETIHEIVGNYYVVPEQPQKDGYRFGGWWTIKSGSEKDKQITEETIVGSTDNTKVYAFWTELKTVSFALDGNGEADVEYNPTVDKWPVEVPVGSSVAITQQDNTEILTINEGETPLAKIKVTPKNGSTFVTWDNVGKTITDDTNITAIVKPNAHASIVYATDTETNTISVSAEDIIGDLSYNGTASSLAPYQDPYFGIWDMNYDTGSCVYGSRELEDENATYEFYYSFTTKDNNHKFISNSITSINKIDHWEIIEVNAEGQEIKTKFYCESETAVDLHEGSSYVFKACFDPEVTTITLTTNTTSEQKSTYTYIDNTTTLKTGSINKNSPYSDEYIAQYGINFNSNPLPSFYMQENNFTYSYISPDSLHHITCTFGTEETIASITVTDGTESHTFTKEDTFKMKINRGKNYTVTANFSDVPIDVVVPSFKNAIEYNGQEQNVNVEDLWNSYNPVQLEISGTYKGTDPNTYTATFTPKTGYQWSGTTSQEPKNVQWTIKVKTLDVNWTAFDASGNYEKTWDANEFTITAEPSSPFYDRDTCSLSITVKKDSTSVSSTIYDIGVYTATASISGTGKDKYVLDKFTEQTYTINKLELGEIGFDQTGPINLALENNPTNTLTIQGIDEDLASFLTVESSDEDIATIEVNNDEEDIATTITAVAGGTATITASCGSDNFGYIPSTINVVVDMFTYKELSSNENEKTAALVNYVGKDSITDPAKTITVPAEVKFAGDSDDNKHKVTTIGDGAKNIFQGSTHADYINLNNGVTVAIAAHAFSESNIITVKGTQDKINAIGAEAFYNCKKLTQFGDSEQTITTPANLTNSNFGVTSFAYCSSIYYIDLTKSTELTSVPQDCFNNTSKVLEIYLNKDKKITNIGQGAFANSKKPKSGDDGIVYDYSKVAILDASAYQNNYFEITNSTRSNVYLIATWAFYQNAYVRKVVIDTNHNMSINKEAFAQAHVLETVLVKDTPITYGTNVFSGTGDYLQEGQKLLIGGNTSGANKNVPADASEAVILQHYQFSVGSSGTMAQGYYWLSNDVSDTANLTVGSGSDQNIVLDLCAHQFSGKGKGNGTIFLVNTQCNFYIVDSTTTSSTSTSGGTITNGGAKSSTQKDGGAIQVSNGNVKIYDARITNSQACDPFIGDDGNGGAISVGKDDGTYSNAYLYVYNAYFDNNYSYDRAGAIFGAKESHITIYNSTFNKNHANTRGGAIESFGVLEINNSKFANNDASGQVTSNERGGALSIGIDNNFCSCTLKYCEFSNNKADEGGGAFYAGNGTIIAENCTFSENKCTEEGGGAAFIGKGACYLTECTFKTNTADNEGGAFYIGGSGEMTINEGCLFESNSSSSDHGGAGYAGGKLTITGTDSNRVIFNNNKAGNNSCGGALYINNSNDVNITNCNFTNNEAELDYGFMCDNAGGAIYNNVEHTVYLKKCKLTGNNDYHYQGSDTDGALATEEDAKYINVGSGCEGQKNVHEY